MIKIGLCTHSLTLVWLLLAAHAVQAQPSLIGAEPMILIQEKAALDRWGHGDPFGFVELAAPDVTYFAEGVDTLIVGYAAFKQVNTALEGKIWVHRYEMQDPFVQVYGEIGILTFVYVSYDQEGRIASRWRASEVYRQMGEDWKLVHSHWTLVREAQEND